MIDLLPESAGNVIGFRMTGKLHDEDYQQFVPQAEHLMEQAGGPVRILALMEDFHGWDMHAAWDDFRFGMKHNKDIERIAMVGQKKWEKWMTRLAKPFIHGQVRFFDAGELDAAWAWLREDA